jgi:hypothetical protein
MSSYLSSIVGADIASQLRCVIVVTVETLPNQVTRFFESGRIPGGNFAALTRREKTK